MDKLDNNWCRISDHFTPDVFLGDCQVVPANNKNKAIHVEYWEVVMFEVQMKQGNGIRDGNHRRLLHKCKRWRPSTLNIKILQSTSYIHMNSGNFQNSMFCFVKQKCSHVVFDKKHVPTLVSPWHENLKTHTAWNNKLP